MIGLTQSAGLLALFFCLALEAGGRVMLREFGFQTLFVLVSPILIGMLMEKLS